MMLVQLKVTMILAQKFKYTKENRELKGHTVYIKMLQLNKLGGKQQEVTDNLKYLKGSKNGYSCYTIKKTKIPIGESFKCEKKDSLGNHMGAPVWLS